MGYFKLKVPLGGCPSKNQHNWYIVETLEWYWKEGCIKCGARRLIHEKPKGEVTSLLVTDKLEEWKTWVDLTPNRVKKYTPTWNLVYLLTALGILGWIL